MILLLYSFALRIHNSNVRHAESELVGKCLLIFLWFIIYAIISRSFLGLWQDFSWTFDLWGLHCGVCTEQTWWVGVFCHVHCTECRYSPNPAATAPRNVWIINANWFTVSADYVCGKWFHRMLNIKDISIACSNWNWNKHKIPFNVYRSSLNHIEYDSMKN